MFRKRSSNHKSWDKRQHSCSKGAVKRRKFRMLRLQREGWTVPLDKKAKAVE